MFYIIVLLRGSASVSLACPGSNMTSQDGLLIVGCLWTLNRLQKIKNTRKFTPVFLREDVCVTTRKGLPAVITTFYYFFYLPFVFVADGSPEKSKKKWRMN